MAADRGRRRLQRRATSAPTASSQLHLTRDLIALRREQPDLREGAYETLAAPEGAWAWRRGEGHAVALNLSDSELTIEGLAGRVAIATDRARDGEAVDGSLTLGAWQGAVIDAS